MIPIRRWVSCAWVLLLLLLGRPSLAQVLSRTPSEEAVLLGHAGLSHFSEGRFHEALAAFSKADELAHSPVFVLYRARATKELGKLLAARLLYQDCAAEAVSESTPDAWRKAMAEAASELNGLRGQVPMVVIKLRGKAHFPVRLTDGERVTSIGEAEMEWELDPGIHELVVEDAVGDRVVLTIAARTSGRGAVVPFDFGRIQPVSSEKPASAPVLAVTELPSGDTYYRTGAWTAFSLGGVALVTSGVAFGIAAKKSHDVRAACDGNTCPIEEATRAESAIRWANVATIGAVTGMVGIVTGGVLLVVSKQSERDQSRSQADALRMDLCLKARANGIDLSGTF